MARNSEFSSYVFIKNDLKILGWNTKNPSRDPSGELYTQQECLDHPLLARGLGRQKPEYVVKINENSFWVMEAKGHHDLLETAFQEARQYATAINAQNPGSAYIVSGVAGNDSDGYLIKTATVGSSGAANTILYNGSQITGFLSRDQARYLCDNNTHNLNELVTDEIVLLDIAEKVNEILHEASINKDKRANVMASILLSMVSDTLPNLNASPAVFVRDTNNRAEDVLINHSKREFASHIELILPVQENAQAKFKQALVRVFFLLRTINVKAAMNGGQDLLGKFYEVFLKYGNGAKDIGIVLTPRHVTRFACDVIDVNENDVVFDPACGTGGFLVSAYDRVQNSNPRDLNFFKKHRIFGVEQQANVAALAVVNMIFRGDGKNNIISDNCFAQNLQRVVRNGELSAEYVSSISPRPPITKVLMNPPFALKANDEKETKFIDHALSQMAPEGLLFAVLPISIMYESKSFVWRGRLLENNTLISVISFPTDLFYPQASVESIAIIIRKGIPHDRSGKICWVRIRDDGFVKHKKKRLPNGNESQLDLVRDSLALFVRDAVQSPALIGLLEFKEIFSHDTKLELIPGNYLASPVLDDSSITSEMNRIFSEIVFQQVKMKVHHENR